MLSTISIYILLFTMLKHYFTPAFSNVSNTWWGGSWSDTVTISDTLTKNENQATPKMILPVKTRYS